MVPCVGALAGRAADAASCAWSGRHMLGPVCLGTTQALAAHTRRAERAAVSQAAPFILQADMTKADKLQTRCRVRCYSLVSCHRQISNSGWLLSTPSSLDRVQHLILLASVCSMGCHACPAPCCAEGPRARSQCPALCPEPCSLSPRNCVNSCFCCRVLRWLDAAPTSACIIAAATVHWSSCRSAGTCQRGLVRQVCSC